jgi:hypothetical protein
MTKTGFYDTLKKERLPMRNTVFIVPLVTLLLIVGIAFAIRMTHGEPIPVKTYVPVISPLQK